MPHVALRRPAVATARMLWACQAVTATQLKATSPANGAEKPSLRVPACTCSFAQLPVFDTEPGPYFRIQLLQPRLSLLASGVLLMSIWPELTKGIAREPLLAFITFPLKNG